MSIHHKLLHISSKDKKTGTNSDFTVNMSNHLYMTSVKSVVVKQISFPNVFYNVRDSNRSFTYKIATVPTTVQIPEGQYSISSFITALQTAVGLGLTIVLDPITNKFDFTTTTAIEYISDVTVNEMSEILGILVNSAGDVLSYSSTGLPHLEGFRNILLTSRTIAANNLVSSDLKLNNAIEVVPVDAGFGGQVHYLSQHSDIDDFDSLSSRHGVPMTEIDIKLVDQDSGEIVDLQNHDVDIILKMYY